LSVIAWSRFGATGAVRIGLVVSVSLPRTTGAPGQHHARTISTVPAAVTILTPRIPKETAREAMMRCFEWRNKLRLIRLHESFNRIKHQQQTKSYLPSALRSHLGNANRLELCPQIYGERHNDSRRV